MPLTKSSQSPFPFLAQLQSSFDPAVQSQLSPNPDTRFVQNAESAYRAGSVDPGWDATMHGGTLTDAFRKGFTDKCVEFSKCAQTNIVDSVDVPHEPVLRQDDRGAYPFPNMNPGNLRYFGVGWHGEIPDGLRYGDFTNFDSATNGLRAMIRNAIRMPERGVIPDLTIRDFVHVATPDTDGNDEQQHAQNIADVSGLGVDDVLDTNDDGTMVDFARGVAQAESSARAADWFTPEEYTNAVRAARVDM